MDARWMFRSAISGMAAVMLLAPAVLADTCCANAVVGLGPTSALPGATVRVTGLRCLAADGTGLLPLRLDAFWLSAAERGAETQPDTVPGPGLPADLPPTDQWHPFDSVIPAADGTGSATITVPLLAPGTYQLWWTCNEDAGPGSGIHYSTGPRLLIGVTPDTSTATERPTRGDASFPLWLVLAFAVGCSVVPMVTRSRDRPTRVQAS